MWCTNECSHPYRGVEICWSPLSRKLIYYFEILLIIGWYGNMLYSFILCIVVNDIFGDRYLCYMSVTSQVLKTCILPSMEGNMLGIVYWFLWSLCKGEQIWTDIFTPQKKCESKSLSTCNEKRKKSTSASWLNPSFHTWACSFRYLSALPQRWNEL